MSDTKRAQQGENKADPIAPYRWKPGQSGNPAGRPKGSVSLKAILSEVIAESTAKGDMTIAEAIVRKTVQDAFKGDKKARELVWAYIDGKPAQSIDLNAVIAEAPIIDDLPRPDAAD